MKKPKSEPKEADWKGLLAAASLFGNAFQALDRAKQRKQQEATAQELARIFKEKQAVQKKLGEIYTAYKGLKSDVVSLGEINQQLTRELRERELELKRLKNTRSSVSV